LFFKIIIDWAYKICAFLSNLGTAIAVMGLFTNIKKINALVRYCLLRTKY